MKKRWLGLSLTIALLTACDGIEYAPAGEEVIYEQKTVGENFIDYAVDIATTVAVEKGLHYISEKSCETNEVLCDGFGMKADKGFVMAPDSVVRYVYTWDGDSAKFGVYDERKGSEEIISVRFLLVNSTEMQGDDGQPEALAEEAKQETQRLLAAAKDIQLEYDRGDKKDKYDRHLMHVFVDGISLQETLLKQGLVKIAYIFEPNTTYLEEYQKAEAIAKKNRLGLWSDDYVH